MSYPFAGGARRQPLEARQAVRDMMESLFVDREDRHLRRAVEARIVERADFQDDGVQARPTGDQMGAAFGAEFPRHRAVEVAARELLGRSLAITESAGRHDHEHIWRAAAEILAFAAVTLRLQHRRARSDIAHR